MKKYRSKARRNKARRSKARRSKARRSKARRSKAKRRKFGYSHDMGPRIYNAHYEDGILLADNAFKWEGNPLARALNAGSG